MVVIAGRTWYITDDDLNKAFKKVCLGWVFRGILSYTGAASVSTSGDDDDDTDNNSSLIVDTAQIELSITSTKDNKDNVSDTRLKSTGEHGTV